MYKIDSSYLSPHVNMAARLEAAAKQYNVEILISGFLYTIVSRKMKHNLRHIDTVTVKGSNVPVGMH